MTTERFTEQIEVMSLVVFALVAAAFDASSAGMDSSQRDPQCFVALKSEPDLGPMHKQARDYFDKRVQGIGDPELRELLVLLAEQAILRNTNRRKIAATCVLLYQVLSLQDKQRGLSASR